MKITLQSEFDRLGLSPFWKASSVADLPGIALIETSYDAIHVYEEAAGARLRQINASDDRRAVDALAVLRDSEAECLICDEDETE